MAESRKTGESGGEVARGVLLLSGVHLMVAEVCRESLSECYGVLLNA